MPIPKPKRGEDQDEFMDRCMSDPTMVDEFSDAEQRLSVCSVTWEDSKKKKGETPDVELKHIIVPFDRKEITDGGYFEGYGSIFGNIDHGGDVVMPGAFRKSLQRWNEKKELPAMVYIHDLREPIGEYKEMREDEVGLFVAGDLWTPDVPRAVQARRMLRSNGPKGLSIGYITVESAFEERDGKTIRLLYEVELMEVSPVLFAMNGLAKPTRTKSLISDNNEPATKRDVEHALCYTLGLSRKQAKAFISGGYGALCDACAPTSQEPCEADEELKAEIARINSMLSGKQELQKTVQEIKEKLNHGR